MVAYKIINELNEDINEDVLNKVIQKTLTKEKITNAIFNIIIVDNKKIKNINKEFRKINEVTDVISFALNDHEDNYQSEYNMLGDIYISLEKTKSQAKEYGHSLIKELSFLTVHGLLHLLGYDHQTEEEYKKMMDKTEVILNEEQIK